MSTKSYSQFQPFILIFLIAVLAQLSTGCSKTKPAASDPVVSNAIVSYVLTATPASISSERSINETSLQHTNGINIQWKSATAFIAETSFESKINGKELEFKKTIGKSFAVLSIPAILGEINVPEGNYDEISFKIKLDAGGSQKSFELNGAITSGSNTWGILFSTNESIELRQRYEHITVTNALLHNALSSLDLNMLTQEITQAFLNTAVKVNGVIIISNDLNRELYKTFTKKLQDLSHNVEFH